MDAITGTGVSRVLTTLGVALAVLLVHVVVWRLALRFMKDRGLAEDLRTHCRWPARLVVTLAALVLALPVARLRPASTEQSSTC